MLFRSRTDFIFDTEEGRIIRRQVAASVREFLKSYIEEALSLKKVLTTDLIRKNPQYMYLRGELDDFVTGLQANSNNEGAVWD